MLEITINHDGDSYMIDVWSDKVVRHAGVNFTRNANELLDMIEELLLDYRTGGK